MTLGLRRLFAVLGFVALLGAACGGGDDSGGEASGGGGGGGGGGTTTLTASDFAFSPTSLTVAAGDSIEVTNEDDAEHNFTAEDVGLDEDIEPGSSVTIDVGDAEPGTYDFHCEYHPDTMTGTLEVTG
jgi:plastocyanin